MRGHRKQCSAELARRKGFFNDSARCVLSRCAVLGRHMAARSPGRQDSTVRSSAGVSTTQRRCRPVSMATTTPRAWADGWWPALDRRRRSRLRGGSRTCGLTTSGKPWLVPSWREASAWRQFGAGSDGSIAVLADATGVPFCLRQAGENDGAELTNEPNTWAMSSQQTTDIGRAQAFYGEMFDWELESVPDAPFSLWLRSGRLVAVVTATDGVVVPPHWSVNFAVRDADAIARTPYTGWRHPDGTHGHTGISQRRDQGPPGRHHCGQRNRRLTLPSTRPAMRPQQFAALVGSAHG